MLNSQQIHQLIENKQAIAIMGPTASGKSHLSMLLAKALPCEIISVDSALIYKGMDIGTAKPTQDELKQVPHHLIDILQPWQTYSASDFVEDVHKLVAEILQRKRIPLLVGGTMMYFNALQKGMANLPSANEEIRQRLSDQWQASPEEVFAYFQSVDPKAAEWIHPNDQQRIFRAIEVYELTGKALSQHQIEDTETGLKDFTLIKMALMPEDRSQLHQQIEKRFLQMLEQGFLNEMQPLIENEKLHEDLPSIRSVGYRQAWQYLKGEWDYDTFVEKGIVATRQLAKRQITWLRKEENTTFLDAFKLNEEQLLEHAIQAIEQNL